MEQSELFLRFGTAIAIGFSERSNRDKQLAKPFALAITVAWMVMFARVLVEVYVVNPALLQEVWLSITAAALAGLLYGGYLFIIRVSLIFGKQSI